MLAVSLYWLCRWLRGVLVLQIYLLCLDLLFKYFQIDLFILSGHAVVFFCFDGRPGLRLRIRSRASGLGLFLGVLLNDLQAIVAVLVLVVARCALSSISDGELRQNLLVLLLLVMVTLVPLFQDLLELGHARLGFEQAVLRDVV